MANFDVFNGDADGICSLIQLRLSKPLESELVTGVKRDISLLDRVSAGEGDQVTVLDISLDKNREGLEKQLVNGAHCFYVDHHFPGDIPEHKNLQTLINTASDTCTSILVNGHLKGTHLAWAVVGAFGDNLKQSALALAKKLTCSGKELADLEDLGILINYNGYGPDIADLHFPPDQLYQRLCVHQSPTDFLKNDSETYSKLKNGYQQDMAAAEAVKPIFDSNSSRVYLFPDESWAKRVSGVFGNDLANRTPKLAHAVVTERPDKTFLISVRAPLENKTGADEICRQFPTGGGRKAAAGINALPADMLDQFIQVLDQYYQ